MPFISSPGALASDNAANDAQKRKAVEVDEGPKSTEPKRQRMVGGFVDDDDDDEEEEEDDVAALRDEHMNSRHDLPDHFFQEPALTLPGIPPVQKPTIANTDIDSTPKASHQLPVLTPRPAPTPPKRFQIKTCAGKTHSISTKKARAPVSYEQMIASRSETEPGKAKKSYYGIDIHQLLDDAAKETEASKTAPKPQVQESIETNNVTTKQKKIDSAIRGPRNTGLASLQISLEMSVPIEECSAG